MPGLSIRVYPDQGLCRRARAVKPWELPSARLVEELFAVMVAAKVVGLSANQVGLDLSLAVIDVSLGADPRRKLVLINPEIVRLSGENVEMERCPSFPGLCARVRRAQTVHVRAWDASGRVFVMEGAGLLGQALQHEVGHLNGEIYLDHL